MKKSIIILGILMLVFNLTYSQTKRSSFSGRVGDANITGTMVYKAMCYLGEPYIATSIQNVKVVSYTYEGKTYYGNQLVGLSFPLSVSSGYLNVATRFRYGINQVINAPSSNFTINSRINDGSVTDAMMSDRYFGGFDNYLKDFLKNQGIKTCTDWQPGLGGTISITIDGGGIGSDLRMQIEKAIKSTQSDNLLNQANARFSAQDYDGAVELYKEVQAIDPGNEEARNRLIEIRDLKRLEEKKEQFDGLIQEGDDFVSNEDYDNALSKYKSALNLDVDNTLAQSRIDDINMLKEEKAEDERLEKDNQEEAVELGKEVEEENQNTKQEVQTTKSSSIQESNSNDDKNSESVSQRTTMSMANFNRNRLTKLIGQARVMEANNQAGTPQYNSLLEEINSTEKALGVSSADSYYTQAKLNEAGAKLATAVTGFAEGFTDGIFTGLRLSLGDRVQSPEGEEEEYFASLNTLTYELGIVVMDKGVFSVGLGFNNDSFSDTEYTGTTLVFGLEVDLWKDKDKFIRFSINGEYGSGNQDSEDPELRSYESVDFYGLGLSATIFKFAYLSYGIGEYKGEYSLNGDSNDYKGEYTRWNFGVRFNF